MSDVEGDDTAPAAAPVAAAASGPMDINAAIQVGSHNRTVLAGLWGCGLIFEHVIQPLVLVPLK
jgi:hypothetical protein